MKKLLLLIVVLSTFGCYQNERNCEDFKTGTFEFTYSIDGEEKTGRFRRTDSLNIDYYEGKMDSSSVRWINDCEFILKKINPQTNAEKRAVHMKILSTTQNSYDFEYKLAIKRPNQPLRVERGTATRVSD